MAEPDAIHRIDCLRFCRYLLRHRVGQKPRDFARSRLAAVLAVLEAGLFLDMAFSVRWQLHDLLEGEAIRENLYAQRVGPQIAALGLWVQSRQPEWGWPFSVFAAEPARRRRPAAPFSH